MKKPSEEVLAELTCEMREREEKDRRRKEARRDWWYMWLVRHRRGMRLVMRLCLTLCCIAMASTFIVVCLVMFRVLDLYHYWDLNWYRGAMLYHIGLVGLLGFWCFFSIQLNSAECAMRRYDEPARSSPTDS